MVEITAERTFPTELGDVKITQYDGERLGFKVNDVAVKCQYVNVDYCDGYVRIWLHTNDMVACSFKFKTHIGRLIDVWLSHVVDDHVAA